MDDKQNKIALVIITSLIITFLAVVIFTGIAAKIENYNKEVSISDTQT